MSLFGASDQKRLFDMHRQAQQFGLYLFGEGRLNLIGRFFDLKPNDGQGRTQFMCYLCRVALQLMKV
jgi:hypothetical protein